MRSMILALAVGCGTLGLAGCGAGERAPAMAPTAAEAPAGYAGGAGTADAPPPPPATALSEMAPPASAQAPGQWSAPEPRPQDRPGLGTEWGEARESHIREVSFLRAEPERPFAVAQLYYNDWQGVQALAAYHGGSRFRDIPAAGGAITVSIRGASGAALDAMHVGERTYVIGREGERYSIVIDNHSARSFEAVATVDGLDVMSGKPGSFEQRGYILGPGASLEIDGFRRTESEVAAFRFSKVRDSYAAQKGEARNVGVIGVAFFGQRGDDWSGGELRTRDSASPFPREGRFAQPPR